MVEVVAYPHIFLQITKKRKIKLMALYLLNLVTKMLKDNHSNKRNMRNTYIPQLKSVPVGWHADVTILGFKSLPRYVNNFKTEVRPPP